MSPVPGWLISGAGGALVASGYPAMVVAGLFLIAAGLAFSCAKRPPA